MCGIVGCVAQRNVGNILLEGLRRLEYRGYDSAGLAIIDTSLPDSLQTYKAVGKVAALATKTKAHKPKGMLGIAHTRWATHGGVTEQNAHPHLAGDMFALVHNGIIENFAEIKKKLLKQNYKFYSETDSEVIVALLLHHFKKSNDNLLVAVSKAVKELEGAYSLAIIHKNHPETLIGVKHGAPLVIGIGEEENFLSSDPLALLQVTDRFIYMADEEIVSLSQNQVIIQNFSGVIKHHEVEIFDHGQATSVAERGEYSHYMLKEIYEQPQAISNTISSRIVDKTFNYDFLGKEGSKLLDKCKNLYIVACGTSYHAALIARYQFEEYLGINVFVEVASEFRYMERTIPPDCLYVTISQSGETADILAALKDVIKKREEANNKKKNAQGHSPSEGNILATLAICNVPSSSLARLCDIPFITAAGPEIGVASTKAFTTQLASLLLLLGAFLHHRGHAKVAKELVRELQKMPDNLGKLLDQRSAIREMAEQLVDNRSAMYIARGSLYPVALEGALKLKEISYIHAEAYQGGELKHGPLALIAKDFPTVALVRNDKYFVKMKSNMQEILARAGPVLAISDTNDKEIKKMANGMLVIPESHQLLSPIFFTLPMQLLSYESAILLGTDVDQPRNLAKSVTVE